MAASFLSRADGLRGAADITLAAMAGAAILAGFGPVPIALHDARLVDHDLALAEVAVLDAERDLL